MDDCSGLRQSYCGSTCNAKAAVIQRLQLALLHQHLKTTTIFKIFKYMHIFCQTTKERKWSSYQIIIVHRVKCLKQLYRLFGDTVQQVLLFVNFNLDDPSVSVSVCLCVCVCVCVPVSDSSKTIEVIFVKLGTVSTSDMRMHHMLIILTLAFIQGHRLKS